MTVTEPTPRSIPCTFFFLMSVLLHLLHFCWLECILTPRSWCFFRLQTHQGGGGASWEDEKDCSQPTTCRSYERGPTITTWSSVLTVVHYLDLNPSKKKDCCSPPTMCGSYKGKPTIAIWSFILNVMRYSETRMTASVLKQDPNTREVQKNAIYLT